MKKNLFIAFILLLLSCVNGYAQSTGFNRPHNGETYTSTGSDNSVLIYFDWGFSCTTYPVPSIAAYSRLVTDSNGTFSTAGGGSIPNNFNVSSGTHSWRIELWELFSGAPGFVKTADQTITFYVKFTVFAANNFGGGSITLEGATVTSGSSAPKFVGESVSVGAIDQSDGTYYRIWNTSGTNNSNWQIHNSSIYGATSRNYSYTVASSDNGATLTADLKKICNVTFQNSFVGGGTGGTVIVGSTQYYSPTSSFQVTELNPISATAQSQTVNGIQYTFSQWSNGSTSATTTFNPGSTITYSANFAGKPSTVGENVHFSTAVGQPLVVYWTDNVNSNVSYKIYRKVYRNGVWSAETLMATVNPGVQQFQDPDYLLANWKQYDAINYDVREYYSVEGTYSNPQWYAVYGQLYSINNNDNMAMAVNAEKPNEYSIANYPNPFNPTTTINYQLPENGFVTIKVYDVLGKEVVMLVNENKSAGYYNVNFDASKLTSGVYIYTINANGFAQTKKMLLMK